MNPRLAELLESLGASGCDHLPTSDKRFPDGAQQQTALAMSRERVRRARLGMELLARAEMAATTSFDGAQDLAIPHVDLPHGIDVNLTTETKEENER